MPPSRPNITASEQLPKSTSSSLSLRSLVTKTTALSCAARPVHSYRYQVRHLWRAAQRWSPTALRQRSPPSKWMTAFCLRTDQRWRLRRPLWCRNELVPRAARRPPRQSVLRPEWSVALNVTFTRALWLMRLSKKKYHNRITH